MSNLYISTYPASYRIDFCNALAREADFRIFHYVETPDDGAVLRDAVFPAERLDIVSRGGKVKARNLLALLEETRPEIVLVQEFSLIALELLRYRKRFGYKVLSLCDDSLDMIRGNDFAWTHRAARCVVPRLLDGLVLHSPEVRDWYRARFGKGFFMPLVADANRVRPLLEEALPEAETLRTRYGLDGTPVVGFVGRLVGLKNIPTLLEAMAGIPARLVLIGDGEERKALETMAAHSGRDVLFAGHQDPSRMGAWYNLLDVLVLPSTREAYGAVTGEALMAGCPVVVSARAGSSSLVREGENGHLVDPGSPAAVAEAVRDLLGRTEAGRPLALRPDLLPYAFRECMDGLLKEINAL